MNVKEAMAIMSANTNVMTLLEASTFLNNSGYKSLGMIAFNQAKKLAIEPTPISKK
jgi:hypothetical protein